MITASNKLLRLHGPQDVRVETLPLEPLASGEIRVRIGAATTCGTDLKTFHRGGHPKIIKSLPSPLGHEMAGQVVEVSEDVERFQKGDTVVVANSAPCLSCFFCKKEKFNLCENIHFINGAYAKYITVPAQFVLTNVHHYPNSLSVEKASLSEPLACVLYASEKINIQKGETVAIIGTGPMAFLFLQVVRAKGASPIILGRNPERLAWAKAAGADAIINNQSSDPVEEMKKLTQGYGADVAIEAVGQPECWQQAIDLVCKGGRVCAYGGCAKGTDFRLDTYRLHYDEITIMGVFHYTPAIMRKAIQLLAEGKINTDLFITEKRSLSDLKDIFLGKEKKTKALKFVINP